MIEGQLALFRGGLDRVQLRNDGDVAVVAHPDCRLMRADEAGNGGVLVFVGDSSHLVLAGLRGPVGHAERGGDKGHGAAVGNHAVAGSDVKIDAVNGFGEQRGG